MTEKQNIVTDLNGCYCEATKENYDKLISDGIKAHFEFSNNFKVLGVNSHYDMWASSAYSTKQIKLNSNNEWVYVEEEVKEEFAYYVLQVENKFIHYDNKEQYIKNRDIWKEYTNNGYNSWGIYQNGHLCSFHTFIENPSFNENKTLKIDNSLPNYVGLSDYKPTFLSADLKIDKEKESVEIGYQPSFFEQRPTELENELCEKYFNKIKKEIISIKDGDNVYEFVKPDFECEIFKKDRTYFIGCLYDEGYVFPCAWSEDGKIIDDFIDDCIYKEYNIESKNLTPIVKEKPWYEKLNNSNGILCKDLNGKIRYAINYLQVKNTIYDDNSCGWKPEDLLPLDNDEIEALKVKE